MEMDLQQQAMANGQGMDIAQQTAQETLDVTTNNMMQTAQNAGLGAAINERNANATAAASGGMLRRGGLDHIPSNLKQMSGGGIVAFANGTEDEVIESEQIDTTSGNENIEFFEAILDKEGVNDPQEREFLKAIYAQESSSGTDPAIWEDGEYKDTGTEPMGGMQVSDIAFRDIENEGLDRTSVEGNLTAGIRYGRKMYQKADQDPRLAAAAYYGGPDSIDIVRSGGDQFDSDNPDYPSLIGYGEDIVSRMGGEPPSDVGVAQQIEESRGDDIAAREERELASANPYGTSKIRPTYQLEPEETPVETETFGDYEQILRTSPNPLSQVGGGDRSQDFTSDEDLMGRRGQQTSDWKEGGYDIAQEYADSMADGSIPIDSPFFGKTRIRRALASDNPALTQSMRRALVEKNRRGIYGLDR